MGLTETLLFYLLTGGGVAVAVWLGDEQVAPGERLFRAATAMLFWPLYVPLLLRRPRGPETPPDSPLPRREPADPVAAAIAQVEAELDTALNSLDGWAEDVLAHERERIAELRAAWHVQADRIRDLDRLLAQPEFLAPVADWDSGAESAPEPVPGRAASAGPPHLLRQSEQARRENIERLRQLRRQLYDDLMGTLAWVRELVTMIHLAKFSGAPASRAEELVGQVAAAVEGLSEITSWRNETLAGA